MAGLVTFDNVEDFDQLRVSADHRVLKQRLDLAMAALLGQRNYSAKAFELVVAVDDPERFELVAGLLSTTSLRFVRRSHLEQKAADVLLLDSFGELARTYAHATAAFVGGTLAPFGGHNPIEPAAAGIPVCFGPSMSNFREIASAFLDADAAEEVASPQEVIDFAARMFDDDAARRELGQKAKDVVERNRGASKRTARRIVELLP